MTALTYIITFLAGAAVGGWLVMNVLADSYARVLIYRPRPDGRDE